MTVQDSIDTFSSQPPSESSATMALDHGDKEFLKDLRKERPPLTSKPTTVSSRLHHALLKFLGYALLERWTSVGLLLTQPDPGSHSLPVAITRSLITKHRDILQLIASRRADLEVAFIEGRSVIDRANHIPEAIRIVRQASSALSHIEKILATTGVVHVRAECDFLTREIQGLAASSKQVSGGLSLLHSPWVVFEEQDAIVPDGCEHAAWATHAAWPLHVEKIPLAMAHNPLGWCQAVQAQVRHASCEYLAASPDGRKRIQALREHLPSEAVDMGPEILTAALLGVRWFGPAWLFSGTLHAVTQFDIPWLTVLEPLIMQAVHFFNFSDKSIILLHESVERSLPLWRQLSPQPANSNQQAGSCWLEGANTKSLLSDCLHWIEAITPQSGCLSNDACEPFTEKHFRRCTQLEDQLGEDVLISAHRPYGPEHLQALMGYGETAHEGEPFASMPLDLPIYDLMPLLTEEPLSAREVITVGWLHMLNRANVLLYDTLFCAPDEAGVLEAGDRLMQHLGLRNQLLLKSIETAQVHRMLLSAQSGPSLHSNSLKHPDMLEEMAS
ncbi:MAG: hypothetical protein VKK59_05930 [Vampirovibrionales bacterium]|nr:hypothetical protein [Vampirovibrionales bacterium]